ncbi:serine/threonine-protein phosphatase [Loktanella salsilacus]|jgi:serine/threonine-protein phosphatase Stp1|uniref:PP2C family protein-serine/threonine phosphatase n=1 Tax=Loktanella salsilacus TaxID=195913 RepID=UPI0020B83FD5|nr:protein phosphatase 2C domain-containing protein [Loktanella salsilacus]UTH47129.1 serine/threonine-protein phosphatase [Loktanella salsilacus]
MTRLRHTATTHVGKVRKVNEDSILSLPEQKVWVVSDGMGGHAAGDFASQTVVDTIATMPLRDGPAEQMQALRQSILTAHDIILAEIDARDGGTIGATVVALMISDAHFVCFWAGDSRLYRLRDGVIEMLTTDHSIVAGLVLSGDLTWDEAEKHPHSNAITRAVGVGDVLELDKVRGALERGDRFLLCSDGLTKYAGFETLRAALQDTPIEMVTDKLLTIALDGGGGDNISFIVVDVI